MLERLARRTVLEMEPYAWEISTAEVAARHGLRPADVLRFDLNTSPYPPASWDAAMEAARAERAPNEYFDTSYAELARLIGPYCGVPPERLVIGAGADEILDIVAKTFLDNGDRVVISAPTYSMYAIVAAQLGATIRACPLGPDFAQPIDDLLAAAREEGAKIIFHCNPNSPTGNATPSDDLERLVAEAPCIVVVDEAYAEFSERPSAVTLLADCPRLLVSRTMSKAFAMAGTRLGYLAASAEVVDAMRLVRLPYHLSALTQAAARTALAHTAELLGTVEAVKAQRDRMVREVRALGLEVVPTDANFLLFGPFAAPGRTWQALLDEGVLVRDVSTGPGLAGWLRVNAGTEAETTAFLTALASVVA